MMTRLLPLISAVAVFVLGVLVVLMTVTERPVEPILSLGDVVVEQPATSTSEAGTLALPQLSIPDLALSTSTPVATTTPAPALPKKSKKPEVSSVPPAATTTPPATIQVAQLVSSGDVSLDAAAERARKALVNIICYAPQGGRPHSISGSGVIVDEKGIILTNAHIAQYFLLTDRDISCIIRTGSPAVSSYKAELIYISPSWIHQNSTVLTQENPIGTGEYDFALLGITKSLSNSPLPSVFPYVPLAELAPPVGAPVVIATYGAQFLETSQIQSALYPTLVFGSVKAVFTFHTNSVDVLALGGSVAAQQGSSGGGVVDVSGTLIGTITTSTIEGETSTRSLDAISASYIRAQYARETGSPLSKLLSSPIASSIADFKTQIADLEKVISAQFQ